MLTDLDSPAAAVLAPGKGCPHAIAIADDIDEGRGRLVVVTSNARPDRVTANRPGNPSFDNRTFDPPTVDGDQVTLPFRYPTDEVTRTPLLTLRETPLRTSTPAAGETPGNLPERVATGP